MRGELFSFPAANHVTKAPRQWKGQRQQQPRNDAEVHRAALLQQDQRGYNQGDQRSCQRVWFAGVGHGGIGNLVFAMVFSGDGSVLRLRLRGLFLQQQRLG